MGKLATVAVALLAAVVACQSAPTAIIQPAQYYLLQPQPATLKIQPHLIHPIQHLKLEPKQYVYYYPSLPLATSTAHYADKPIPLLTLKQEEGTNWWNTVFGFFQPPTTEMPAAESETTEAPPAAAESSDAAQMPQKQQLMFMAPSDAEQLPAGAAGTPASTIPLGHRYYILSGTPQFYGNFDALQNPLNPVFSLQPLQAIHARSSSGIQAEGEQQKLQAQIVSSIAPIAPVPAPVPQQLKNDLLESHPDKEQTIDRAWARALDDDEQQPEQAQLEDEPVIVQGRSQSDEPRDENLPVEDEEKRKDESMVRSVDDPAIAAVKPSAIALAGRGGVAASAPTGTAVVGKNGLALSSPTATSVAGNFFEDDDEDKKM